MRTPIKDDGTTVFTFELDPIAVYSCSNNLNVAEYYSTFMIWYIAQNRWKNIDVNIMAAIDIAIGLKAIELFNNANLHLNESLQVQFSCNDSALAVVEFFRGIEMIFMTFKLINQPYLLQNLPLIDIPAF